MPATRVSGQISSRSRHAIGIFDARRTSALYALILFALLAAGYSAFTDLGGGLFFSWDSASQVAFANEAFANGRPFAIGPSYSQSLGNLAFPIDYWLMPDYLLSVHEGRVSPARFYLVVTALFFSCAFGMALLFQFGRWLAAISAACFVMLTLPFTSPAVLTELFWWHAPFMIPLVYMTMPMLALFYLIGRQSSWLNVLMTAVLGIVVLWVTVGYPKLSAVIFLGTAAFCLVFAFGAESLRELLWKIGAAMTIGLVFLNAGLWDFMRGIYGYTGNFLYFETMDRSGAINWKNLYQTMFYSPSVWIPTFLPNLIWVKSHMGYVLPCTAIFGAMWALLSSFWARPAKLLAVVMLLTFPFSFVSVYGSAHPAQIYYLMFLFSLVPAADIIGRIWKNRVHVASRINKTVKNGTSRTLALIGVSGTKIVAPIENVFRSVWRRRAFAWPWPVARPAGGVSFGGFLVAATLIALFAFATAIALPRPAKPRGYPYPPSNTGVTEFLSSNIRFGQGDTFRGRYLGLTLNDLLAEWPEPSPTRTTAQALTVAGARLALSEGNDLTFAGPRFFEIPVTVEYNRMSTPFSAVFHNYLLVQEGHLDRIDYRTITIFDPRLLGLIGVRFVLSKVPPIGPGAHVAIAQPLKDRQDVSLYEIDRPNLGGYSPTQLRYVDNAEVALTELARPDLDVTRQALIHEPMPDRVLTPATSAKIRRTRNGIHVEASASGWSYIVLPFEFSRCLVVGANAEKPPHSIGRTNLLLTGILFDRTAEFDLRFKFGPFENQDCRMRDMDDVRALGLSHRFLDKMAKSFKTRMHFGGLN